MGKSGNLPLEGAASPDGATRDFVVVGGAGYEVLRHAPASDAPAILFLHEGLGSAGLWRDFPSLLAARTGFGAISYSRLGYGASDPCPLPRPLDYMEREAREALPLLIEALGLRRFVLFGHSDGGSIALLYAALNPAPGLLGVVTEAAHVFCEELTLRSIRKAAEAYAIADLREKLARHHGKNVDNAFYGWSRLWLDPGFASWDFREKLAGFGVPLLSIQGSADEYGTMEQLRILRDLAGARLCVIDGAGHSPHRERPEETLAAAAAFIATLPAG